MSDLAVDPWIDRIADQVKVPQKLRAVEGIAELGLIRERIIVPPVPAVYVAPESETGQPNLADANAMLQSVREEFAVVSAVENRRDMGQAAHNALRALRRALKDALINWRPDAEADNVQYLRGRLWNFDSGLLLWIDHYGTGYTEYKT